MLDFCLVLFQETSDSPHISGVGGGSTTGGNAISAGAGGSRHLSGVSVGIDSGGSGAHKQPQTPPPMYPCVYCNAAFPHQSKLTRHMLSHSLKSLEYRETTTHQLLHPHLLSHDLNMPTLSQHFAAYQINAAMSSGSTDPQDAAAVAAAAAAMELDFAAAVAAAGGCAALTGFAGCGTGRSGLDLDCSGVGGNNSGNGTSGIGGGIRSSAGGNSGVGSSNLLLSGSGTSSSTSAAAAAASTSSALLSSSSNDPNSAVTCKFCGKSFPDIPSLISHVPVHTGDRPFKCEYCGKAFKLRHHMKDHCRVHTGERPFRCPMCGKTFSRSTILKAHEKTHFPKYVRKFMPPSPVDTKDELPQ